MKLRKNRRPLGRLGYALCWIVAIWFSLGFLGTPPKTVLQIVHYYPSNKGMAVASFEGLLGELIVGAIGVLCILEIRDTRKVRKALKEAQAVGATPEES